MYGRPRRPGVVAAVATTAGGCSAWKRRWREITGLDYANTRFELTPAQVATLPTITFVFADGVASVDVKPEAFMEHVSSKFVPRIYVTEAGGSVLGANFMQDHDVLFDSHNNRLGFATAK